MNTQYIVALFTLASFARAGSDWCSETSNLCPASKTGVQSNLACGFCRDWILGTNIASDTLRLVGIDGSVLPGDGNSSNNYIIHASLTTGFDLTDGSNWQAALLPSTVPRLSDSVLLSSKDNSTVYYFGGRSPGTTTTTQQYQVPELTTSDNSWTLPISEVTVGRFADGAHVNVPSKQAGYYIGGWQTNATSSSITDGLEHFATSALILNTTTAATSVFNAPFLPVQFGATAFLPYGDSGILVYFGGESPSSTAVADCKDCHVNSWDHVWIYDIAQDQWHSQNTTGYVQPRSEICISTHYDHDSQSWQIWAFGGSDFKSSQVLSLTSVLSIPSFQWFNATAGAIRMSQACETVGSQVFLLGGRNQDTAVGGTDYPAIAYIYDVNKQATATTFDPALTTYAAPTSIKSAISSASTPTSWDSAVQRLFVTSASSAPQSTSPAISSATSSASSGSSSGGLSAGEKAGIAVGAVVGAALILAAIVAMIWLRRRAAKRKQEMDKSEPQWQDVPELDSHNQPPAEMAAPNQAQMLSGDHRHEIWELAGNEEKAHPVNDQRSSGKMMDWDTLNMFRQQKNKDASGKNENKSDVDLITI